MNTMKKYGIIAGSVIVIFCIFAGYCAYNYETGPIYTFNPDRDTKEILTIFDENWYWLIANPGSSPAFMLKYKTPYDNPLYFGKLHIKVLREDNRVAGFIAYFMENYDEWRLLFLAVGNDFRRKGYGLQLAKQAVAEMTALGAKKICLWTRLDNTTAQKIYKSMGFAEVYHTETGYVFFEYIP